MPDIIGYIAVTSKPTFLCGKNGETPWSDSEWNVYINTLLEAGCLIVGRHEHEELARGDGYNVLSDAFQEKGETLHVVVLTRNPLLSVTGSASHIDMTTALTPNDAVQQLTKKGFSKIIVGGGIETFRAFLESKALTHLQLDREQLTLESGIPLKTIMPKGVHLTHKESRPYGEGKSLFYSCRL